MLDYDKYAADRQERIRCKNEVGLPLDCLPRYVIRQISAYEYIRVPIGRQYAMASLKCR